MSSIDITVDEFTTPDPITATEEMSIDELRALMDEYGVRHLPVIRDKRVVGLISDRDIRVVSGLDSTDRQQVRAADIMTENPLIVDCNALLSEVAYRMSERKVGSVIVNDDNGELLGIFTATDALNALVEIVRELDMATREDD